MHKLSRHIAKNSIRMDHQNGVRVSDPMTGELMRRYLDLPGSEGQDFSGPRGQDGYQAHNFGFSVVDITGKHYNSTELEHKAADLFGRSSSFIM